MFLTKVTFVTKKRQTYDINQALAYCNQLIDAWRYNGQIIGREIPITYQFTADDLLTFVINVNCPEKTSLNAIHNSTLVTETLDNLQSLGITLDHYEIYASDLNSDEAISTLSKTTELVLYTNYLKSSSPVCELTSLAPVPLYHLCYDKPQLGIDCIKWEENWQACDQLQMNGHCLVAESLTQISELTSPLAKQGYALRQQLEAQLQRPVYYYLYRVNGQDYQTEIERCCPRCGQEWFLHNHPINIFDFKCDDCRLVSNIAWELQE
ncbi:DUF2310 family Zn-ribbon-containing protein [Gallibacterium melopsittaci]|uniref:DUF2310 family Zn-ribbon-containing protein n=1 Tax=Gallibacterium melopsittaci TaxID=516063 RepID=A0ABV6HYG7_9PAST